MFALSNFKDLFCCQIKKKLIPIKIYKTVHTGPKIQFGGLKKGFSKTSYHVFIEFMVKKDDEKPINSGIKIETKSCKNVFIFDLLKKLNNCSKYFNLYKINCLFLCFYIFIGKIFNIFYFKNVI